MQKIILMLIRFYQKAVSPHIGPRCKFYPTCSEYAILSIKKYGISKGSLKTVLRISKCNPLSKGGVDFP
jgi:putative membrane protein insertion efficiency factor